MAAYYWTGTASLDLWIADLEQWQPSGELRLQPAAIGMQGRIGGSPFKGDKLYLQHSLGTPNGRISVIDLSDPDHKNWRDLVTVQEYVLSFAAHPSPVTWWPSTTWRTPIVKSACLICRGSHWGTWICRESAPPAWVRGGSQ